MRKIGVAALLLLFVVAVALAVVRRQVNRYAAAHQHELAAWASAALGRTVHFTAVRISLRHGVGVTIEGLRIADDPRFADADFLSAERTDVTIAVLPALLGRLDVRRLQLDHPHITVIRSDDGLNVDSLGRIGQPAPAPASPGPPARPAGGESRAERMPAMPVIAAVQLRGGSASFVDRRRASPAEIRVDRLDLSASNVGPASAVDFTLRAAALGAATQNVRAHGTVSADRTQPLAVDALIDGMVIDDLANLPLADEFVPPRLSSPDPLRLALRLEGSLAEPRLILDADATAAVVRYGTMFEKPAGTPLTVHGEARPRDAPPRIDVQALRVGLAGVEAWITGTLLGGRPPSVDLTLSMPQAAIAGLEAVFPALAERGLGGSAAAELRVAGALDGDAPPAITGTLMLRDVTAGSPDLPGRVSALSATVTLAGDSAELPPTTVSIGDQRATVTCHASRLPAATATCALAADAITPGAFALAASPGDIVRDLRVTAVVPPEYPDTGLQAEVHSAAGVLHGVPYTRLDATARVRRHDYVLEHAAVTAFGGSLSATGRCTIGPDRQPTCELQAALRNLRLAPLLATQQRNGAPAVDGRVAADVSIAAAGRTWVAVREAAHGSGRLEVRDGAFARTDLADGALGGLAGIISKRARQRHPELFGQEDLTFDALSASFRIADGRVHSDDVRLRARDFDVEASGSAAFDGRLDGRGTLALSAALTSDLLGGGGALRDVAGAVDGLDIPFTVSGTIEKPRIRPTAGAVVDTLGRGVGALLDKSGGREAEDLLRKGLDHLFGH